MLALGDLSLPRLSTVDRIERDSCARADSTDALAPHTRSFTAIKMFFLYELERTITLHPSFFGPRVSEYLTRRLLEDVEGTCTGQYYIITVVGINDISEGKVLPGSGIAEYTLRYSTVVWRPFKGETVCWFYLYTPAVAEYLG